MIHFEIVRVQVQGYEKEESDIWNISRWRQGVFVQTQTQGEHRILASKQVQPAQNDNPYLIAEWNELSFSFLS